MHKQYATAHDVNAKNLKFLVHGATRPTGQHDEKRKASTQLNSANHWRINVCYTLLDTVARQLQNRFHDDTIGIFEEMNSLLRRSLCRKKCQQTN